MKYIPQIEPWIDHEELAQLTEVINSTYISEHKKTEQFLDGIKEVTGSPHAIAISNGTLALVACLLAEGICKGDEVIVPNLTFIATSNAVILVGAKPIFCDVLEHNGSIDPVKCELLINEKTKAIIPVHLYGQAADVETLSIMTKNHNLVLIEDAAESFGMTLNGKALGTFGDYAIFSFFANKTITCGEGGVVLAKTQESYDKIYRIKNHGRDRKGIFIHEQIGYNFCFTDLQAAVGVSQLGKLSRILSAKQENYDYYLSELENVDGISVSKIEPGVVSNHWFVNIFTENPQHLSEYLHKQGIGTRRFFYPLHRQPCYGGNKGEFPISDKLFNRGLSLPSSPILSNEERAYVVSSIKKFLG